MQKSKMRWQMLVFHVKYDQCSGRCQKILQDVMTHPIDADPANVGRGECYGGGAGGGSHAWHR